MERVESAPRLYLRVAVKLMLCIGVIGIFWVLFQSTGDRRSRSAEASAETFFVGDMQPGTFKTVVWANKPLLIMHRLPEWESALRSLSSEWLRDPSSHSSVQPVTAKNELRSPLKGWFVAVSLGTGMGCPLSFLAPSEESFKGSFWPGGFADSCDGSRYDFSGRVFSQQSARKNIVVPPWRYFEGNIIVGGALADGSQNTVRD